MIEEIIKREWEFFQEVHHIDGRASCQDDFDTFQKQRSAQFMIYSDELLESYLQDLKNAKKNHRNLIYEKYAYMMEYTDKEYYEKIKDTLPKINHMQKDIVEVICQIEVGMREELNQQYPSLSKLSRTTYTKDDEQDDTSFETYLRGELYTYSPETLYLYGKMVTDKAKNHQNMIIEIMENTVKAYGYKSILEAEQKMEEIM